MHANIHHTGIKASPSDQTQEDTITINQDAPVIATGEIEVNANPEVVWDIMVAIRKPQK